MLKIGDKKLINAWAFYDWANSVYSLVISTAVFPLFYSGITKGETVSFLGMEWDHPDTLYSYALSFSFLVVAFMSPILSAIADYTGNKKKFLKIFCTIGSVSVMSLYFFDGLDTVWIGIVFTFFASIGFWSSIVFYNAYLPEVAHPEDQDRVSAKGFIYGYIGSVILLVINLGMIMAPELFGFDVSIDESIRINGTELEITQALEEAQSAAAASASRISFVMVGLWWIGFAQITFKRLPNNVYEKKPDKDYIWKGFRELKNCVERSKRISYIKEIFNCFFLTEYRCPNNYFISYNIWFNRVRIRGNQPDHYRALNTTGSNCWSFIFLKIIEKTREFHGVKNNGDNMDFGLFWSFYAA